MNPTNIGFDDLSPPPVDLRAEVLAGLRQTPKRLPPKLFYDQRGSALFDAITRLPEYYPTRCELAILRERRDEILARLGRHGVLIEYGSGSSEKIRLLLETLRPALYMPLDISREHLLQACAALAKDHPWLRIHAVAVDYSSPWRFPAIESRARRIGFFPGSSIGNFEPEAARRFLAAERATLGPDGGFLLGVDLKKDPQVLHTAYNDSDGITAAFNRNILEHINRALDASIDPQAFEHRAFYNEPLGRIEMHLVSLLDQSLEVAGETLSIAAQESIHTENSYKYSKSDLVALASGAGFDVQDWWTDDRGYFALAYLEVAQSAPTQVTT